MYTKLTCKAILDEFHAEFSKKKFEFNGLDWWPVIWIQVAYRVSLLPLNNSLQDYSETFVPEKTSLKKKAGIIANLIKYKTLKKRQIKTVIVYTDKNNKTSLNTKGRLINQFTDPFLDNFNTLGISYDINYINDIQKDLHPLLKAFSSYYKSLLYKRIIKSNLIQLLVQIENFCLEKTLPIKNIRNLLVPVIVETQLTYKLLDLQFQHQPYKYSLFYCYYNNNCMAISRASRANKIEAIEYQHSLISDQHFAYMNWQTISQKSKTLFPTTFWLWDQNSKNVIDKNFSSLNGKRTIIGGNVYSNYFLETYKRQNSDIKSVLVSLQGLGLPDFVLNTIESNKSIKWYLRLHPRYPNDRNLIEELAAKYPDRIDIVAANEQPLAELFSKVNYHVTRFSGTALEAQIFGVSNLILGEEGKEAYKSQIEEGLFIFVESEKQLTDILNSQTTTKSPDNYINPSVLISDVFKN